MTKLIWMSVLVLSVPAFAQKGSALSTRQPVLVEPQASDLTHLQKDSARRADPRRQVKSSSQAVIQIFGSELVDQIQQQKNQARQPANQR